MIIRILAALSFGLMMTGAASAAPLVTAMFGAGFAASLPGALLSFGLSLGGSYLLNQVFGGQQSAANDNRDPAQKSYGEREPFRGVVGRVVLGGHNTHYNEYDDAKISQDVLIIADQLTAGLECVYVNGRQCELVEVAGPHSNNEQARFRVDGYDDLIDIRFHDGRPGQLADNQLVAQSAGWDANYTHAGKAYVAVEFKSDREKFGGSQPDLKLVALGGKWYDPRKDSSIGGSGAHRFNDPMTWEYTCNPAVVAYHFARGIWVNGFRCLGAELTPADLHFESFITAMNICDEQVQRPDGSYRNRYECNLTWDDEQAPYQVIDQLCAAMGGVRGEIQGQIAIFAGKAKVPVLTITDADIVDNTPIRFTPKASGTSLYSGVQGTYTHSTEFTPKAYKSLNPAAFVVEDGRSRLNRVDLAPVQDTHQAYLLAKLLLFLSRLQATAEITLDIKDLMLEVGDWIVWDSAKPVRGNRTYEIQRLSLDWDAGRMALELREVSADAYADDATAAEVAEETRDRPLFGYQKDVFGFGVEAVAIIGAVGENLPGLKFTYNPITDPAIRGLKVEYRVQGGGQVFKATDRSVGDGVFYVSDGVMPGWTYEARAVLDAAPGREVNWTNWTAIAVPTGPMVVISPSTIDRSHLAEDLNNEVGVLNGTGAGSLAALIDHLTAEIERVANATVQDELNSHVERQLISATAKNAAAAVLQEQTVRAEEDEALAQAIVDASAAMGSAYAQGLFKVDAIVNGDGSEATMTLKVRAGDGSNYVDSGIRIIAKSDGTSQVALVANETAIIDDQGTLAALFAGDGKIDGAFIPTLTVNELSAISADVGTLTAGKLQSSDGKFVIDLDAGSLTIYD